MTQRDLAKIAGGFLIGIAAAAVVMGVFGPIFGGADTQTDVTLSMIDGKCEMGKATHVRVRQDKHLIWKISNYCTDGTKTVSVGNFRRIQGGPAATPAASAQGACTEAGADYPFTPSGERSKELAAAGKESNGRIDPTKGTIKLRAQKLLGDDEEPRLYAFDVCLGGVKQDPSLIFER